MTTPEPHKMVFIGALDVDRGETVTLNIPPDADAATVRSAIEAANAERAAKQAQESEALEKLFLNKVAIDKDGEK
jgi:hypothetical protein